MKACAGWTCQRIVGLWLLAVMSAVPARAVSVDRAVSDIKQDIERDTAALNQLRERIDKERQPLAEELQVLQKKVAGLRAEAEQIQQLRRQSEKEQQALLAQAEAVEEECRFLQTLFAEYARGIEMRVNVAEVPRVQTAVGTLVVELADKDDWPGLAGRIDRLLTFALDKNRRRLGGDHFPGEALDASGTARKGTFAVFGPQAYFSAGQGELAGLALLQFGSDQPTVYVPPAQGACAAVRRVVEGPSAVVPVDVTEGDAMKVVEARATLWEHIRKGGFVMIPLLALGAVAALLALYKIVELSFIHVRGGNRVQDVVARVRAGDVEGARQLAHSLREPLAALVAEGVEHHASPRDHLEEIMHERVLSTVPRLERHLGTLAVLGGIAPLLGLLGTVTGMIHTFQLVTVFGSGDARLLSGGISEALVTTEFGLAIAIPILLVHAFLARRARSIVGALEQTAVALVNELKVRTNGT